MTFSNSTSNSCNVSPITLNGSMVFWKESPKYSVKSFWKFWSFQFSCSIFVSIAWIVSRSNLVLLNRSWVSFRNFVFWVRNWASNILNRLGKLRDSQSFWCRSSMLWYVETIKAAALRTTPVNSNAISYLVAASELLCRLKICLSE